ncbi:MAG: glycosyltransferase family 1 protein [Chloroflexota bacterium]
MRAAATLAYDAGPVQATPNGVGVYVRELALALLERRSDDDDVVLIGARRDGPLAGVARTLMRGERHQVWVQRHANADVRSASADLVHYTNAIAPLRSVRPFVLTIQDLSLVRYPYYHPKLRLAAVPVMMSAAHRARAVMVPSRATADELHRLLRVPPRRIVITELAPGPDGGVENADPSEVLARFGLERGRYIVSTATLEPRKNIARLVAAFEQLAARDADLRLVLVGAVGWRTSKIELRLASSPVEDRIVRTGFVSDADRMALIEASSAFVYVSLYEGYGLPIVEAMSAGAPVVTSNLSSMPEAAGGAAVLVDPLDPGAIAAGVEEAIQQRPALVKAGRRRAAKLSWTRTAEATRAVYQQARGRWV